MSLHLAPDLPAAANAAPDSGLWAAFVNARTDPARHTAWLAILVSRVPGCVLGVVIEADAARGAYLPTAVVPDARRDLSTLVPAAEKVLASGRPALLPGPEDARYAALPITLAAASGQAPATLGAVVLDLRGVSEADAQAALREMHWAAGWLTAKGWQARATDVAGALVRAQVALDILACASEHAKAEAAAMAVVNQIQTALGADQVSIGMVRGRARSPRIKLLALSYSAWFRKRSALVETLETAMEEAFDQMASVSHPPVASLARAISVAHADHVAASRTQHMLTAVLSDEFGPVGALTAERRDDIPFTESDRQMAEAIAALIGPVLELKRRNRRWFGGRLVDGGLHVLGLLLGPRHLSWKLLALVLLGFGVAATQVQGPFRLQADAVLRGEFNRAVAAPFAGFVAEAPLRAGDQVAKGDLLVRLDDADLRLETLRWRSELDRLASQSRDALARKDRAEVALVEAQLAQARAQSDLAQAELDRSELRAPIDGVIVTGDLSQKLGGPVQLGEVLFEIAPLDRYRVDIFVDERDLSYIATGMAGTLALTGQPTETLALRVNRITPLAEVRDGANTFRIEASLDAAPTGLRPGMEGVAKLDAGEALAVWVWSRRMVDWMRRTAWTWQP